MSKGLLRSTSWVGFNTLLSRIFGFARDVILAQIFGATAGMDAFLVAFKLPNFMRRLFAEGAFSQAFVPVLAEYQSTRSHAEVKSFIARIQGTLGTVLLGFVALSILLAPLLVIIFAPGFLQGDLRFHLASHMLCITFPYLFFIALTALAGAALNTYGSYGVPAFTPVLLNVVLIFMALQAAHFTTPVYALAWGVFIAGIVQFLFQLPFLAKKDLLSLPQLGFHDPGVRKVMRLMVPALFGVSVAQISILVDTLFASFLPQGSVSWLYYADRITQFPLGIFGTAIATVILPFLARDRAKADHESYSHTLDWAIRLLMLVGLPAAVALLILSGPLLATLLYYGKFTILDVRMSSESLMAYSIGLLSFMLIKVFASGFYGRQNIKTPVKIAAVAMLSNIIFNGILIWPLAQAGLALATSLSATLNAGLLLYFLLKHRVYRPRTGSLKVSLQITVATAVMAAFLFVFAGHLDHWLQQSMSWRILHLLLGILSAMLIYALALGLLGLRPRHFRR